MTIALWIPVSLTIQSPVCRLTVLLWYETPQNFSQETSFEHQTSERQNPQVRYPDNLLPGQFSPDNLPPIFKQLAPHSFIHYRVKRAAKYMRLEVKQIIFRSFIHYRTNYSSFCYPLPSLKIGREFSGVNCLEGELSDIHHTTKIDHDGYNVFLRFNKWMVLYML